MLTKIEEIRKYLNDWISIYRRNLRIFCRLNQFYNLINKYNSL